MKANTEVPKTLSAAIRMALADQEIVEKLPNAVIDMDYWHSMHFGREVGEVGGKEVEHCHMCFAGAVMHCRFDLGLNYYCMDPYQFPLEWASVFRALDAVREGNVNAALKFFGHDTEKFKNLKPSSYRQNRVAFREDMLSIAIMLEGEGL